MRKLGYSSIETIAALLLISVTAQLIFSSMAGVNNLRNRMNEEMDEIILRESLVAKSRSEQVSPLILLADRNTGKMIEVSLGKADVLAPSNSDLYKINRLQNGVSIYRAIDDKTHLAWDLIFSCSLTNNDRR